MSEEKDKLNQLQQKLDSFLNKQEQMQKEMLLLRSEIRSLQIRENFKTNPSKESPPVLPINKEDQKIDVSNPKDSDPIVSDFSELNQSKRELDFESNLKPEKNWLDFEKLIGENIINKIGIVITVIGIAIGSNYVIENDLISPALRIIIGYLISFGLAGVAYWLKSKYLNYSAVLMGGAMAAFYVLTFASYDFYGLISQLTAFILMTVITIVTVVTAIGYNKEGIAVFGLVGGYAVPFLIGGESENIVALFSYVLFINFGVLIVALQKYWRILHFSAFSFTWLIFLLWYYSGFDSQTDVSISITFSTIFFLIFYTSGLAYKVRNKEPFLAPDISVLLINTFLYFGLVYSTLDYGLERYQGLLSVLVAGVHFIAGRIVKYFDPISSSPLNLINGLVLIFLTLTIPIQFQDQWVTLAWSLEALLLLWLGRAKGIKIYEVLSFPVMILAFLGMISEWIRSFLFPGSPSSTLPFINSLFATFLIFWGCFVFIQYLGFKYPYEKTLKNSSYKHFFFKIAIPFILVSTLYSTLLFEVGRIFYYWKMDTAIHVNKTYGLVLTYNPAIDYLKSIWLINYSFSFLAIGAWVNKKWFQIKKIDKINIGLTLFVLILFFSSFFAGVKSLRELFLGTIDSAGFNQSVVNILTRYIFIAFACWGIYTLKGLLRNFLNKESFVLFTDNFLAFTTLFLLSVELIQWLDIAGFENSYKLGLSILWGICSLGLILYGILNKRKHLRIAAMCVFSITLMKLFFYDISHLSTISKTIVFLSLGIILLIISYFYNRFKDMLLPNEST